MEDKRSNRMSNGQSREKKGFTIVEMMIVVGILAISFEVAIGIFTQVIRTANRSQTANEIRANASYALDQMVREIQKGERMRESFSALTILNSEGKSLLEFRRQDFTSGPLTCYRLIRDNGSSLILLTSDRVNVSRLDFQRPSENKIKIEMTVEQCHPLAATRPEYRGSFELAKEVTLRNYAAHQ